MLFESKKWRSAQTLWLSASLFAALVTAALERRFEPDAHQLQRGTQAHHSLAERDDVGIVMLAAKPGGLGVPA